MDTHGSCATCWEDANHFSLKEAEEHQSIFRGRSGSVHGGAQRFTGLTGNLGELTGHHVLPC